MSVLNNKQKGVAASTHLLCGMQPLHLYYIVSAALAEQSLNE